MKQNILLILSLCLYVTGYSNPLTANVITAGTLSSVLGISQGSVTNLTVTGSIDARDFKTLRDAMPQLDSLDLSKATIIEYNGTDATAQMYSTTTKFPANAIPESAFINKTLQSVIMPENLKSIEDYAFSHCKSILRIVIPNTVTSIGTSFVACSSLNDIIIPEGIKSIEHDAFGYCSSLIKLTIPNSVTYIGKQAFLSCSGLTDISLGNSVDTIGENVFCLCSRLSSVALPKSVRSIGRNAFFMCSSLANISVDAANLNYTSIGGVLFNKSATRLLFFPLTKQGTFNIPDGVEKIDDFAFAMCSGLSDVTLPNTVDSIGNLGFASCTSLKTLSIPASVKWIGEAAFEACSGLTSIYVYSKEPITLNLIKNFSDYYVFDGIDTTTCILYVPAGSIPLYAAKEKWKDFKHMEEITTSSTPSTPSTSISLYPNPCTQYIRATGFEGASILLIKDLTGNTLLSKQISSNEYIPVNQLAKGVYVVKITTSKGSVEKKFLRQ